LLWQLSRPLATAAFGRIGSSDEGEAAALTARCIRHSFAFVTAASIVAFFIGPTLITLIYGSQFAAAGTVLRLLLPGIIAYCIMPFLATFYIQQLGRPSIPLLLSTISTVVCAGFTWAFIPRYGMGAGAAATSASYVTAVGIATVLFCRRTGMNFTELFALNRDDMKQYMRLLTGLSNRIAELRVNTKPTP
jgi:O-antigen/teichoic acid export membrane protein